MPGDRMSAVDGPAGDLIRQSRRLLRMIRARDSLTTQAQLVKLDREHLLRPAVRSWLLVLAELGAARLPGGVLAEPDNAGGLIRADVGPAETVWQHDLRAALAYAVDRDGDRLYGVVEQALGRPDVLAFLSGLAASVQTVGDSLALRPEVINAAHLLGYNCKTPAHWSVAGFGLRQIVATLAVMDTDAQFAADIVGPEIDALAKLDSLQRAHLLAVMGPAFAALIDDDDHFVIRRAGPATGAQETGQVRSAELAMIVGKAYRGSLRAVLALADDLNSSEIGLAVYGLGNMLAVRCRELWGR